MEEASDQAHREAEEPEAREEATLAISWIPLLRVVGLDGHVTFLLPQVARLTHERGESIDE